MTKVEFVHDNNHWLITISGHADYSNNGNDIVCASCSLLTTMIAQIIEDDKENIKVRSMAIDSGHAVFDFSILKYRSWIEPKFQTIITGFELLENQYPSNVWIASDSDV